MNRTRSLLKMAAVGNAILLVVVFVAYRAGVFHGQQTSSSEPRASASTTIPTASPTDATTPATAPVPSPMPYADENPSDKGEPHTGTNGYLVKVSPPETRYFNNGKYGTSLYFGLVVRPTSTTWTGYFSIFDVIKDGTRPQNWTLSNLNSMP